MRDGEHKAIDYNSWAEEYKNESAIIQDKLNKLKAQQKSLKANDEHGILGLKRRIAILSSMLAECEMAYKTLKERSQPNVTNNSNNSRTNLRHSGSNVCCCAKSGGEDGTQIPTSDRLSSGVGRDKERRGRTQ